MRSSDHGASWSKPVVISPMVDRTVTTPGDNLPLRTGDIAAWKARNAALHERFRQILGELRAADSPDLAMLSVALRELRNLA